MYSVATQYVTGDEKVMARDQWSYHFNFFLIFEVSFKHVIMPKSAIEFAKMTCAIPVFSQIEESKLDNSQPFTPSHKGLVVTQGMDQSFNRNVTL